MSIEAMKQALEAFESIPEDVEGYLPESCTDAVIALRTAIRKALAQPDVDRRSTESKETFDQQEPVAYTGNGTAGREADVKPTGFFFQMPPQRTWEKPWVSLTDDEIWETEPYKMAITDQETRWLYRFAKTIEAILKEKNT